METRPICPYCITEIAYDDMTDESFDTSTYEVNWRGICPICGKRFAWTEIYRYSHLDNFKEEIDNG